MVASTLRKIWGDIYKGEHKSESERWKEDYETI